MWWSGKKKSLLLLLLPLRHILFMATLNDCSNMHRQAYKSNSTLSSLPVTIYIKIFPNSVVITMIVEDSWSVIFTKLSFTHRDNPGHQGIVSITLLSWIGVNWERVRRKREKNVSRKREDLSFLQTTIMTTRWLRWLQRRCAGALTFYNRNICPRIFLGWSSLHYLAHTVTDWPIASGLLWSTSKTTWVWKLYTC